MTDLIAALQAYFGFSSFREGQVESIQSLLYASFSVGAAMGRNRLIYTLADYAIVVASDLETGGTWAGAVEALKNDWIPVFVLEHSAMPEGNKLLLKKGAVPFPHPFKEEPLKLSLWLREHSHSSPERPGQLTLF